MLMALRTVCESSAVADEIDRLKLKHARFDEWWELGWKWRLARDPQRDAQRISQNIFMLKTSANHAGLGFPFTLTLLYTATDDEVDILHVRLVAL